MLSDPTVSRAHLLVEVEGGKVRVSDNHSTNGATLDGVRIRSAEAKVGSVIKLGETELRLMPLSERPSGPPPSEKDRFGERLFYFYTAEILQAIAGPGFETAYEDHQLIGHTRWLTLALKRK